MSHYGEMVADEVQQVIVAGPAFVQGLPGTWLELPFGVGVGWTTADSGATWVGPNGEAQPVEQDRPKRQLLTSYEWHMTFTEAEWTWLKAQRALHDRLDQLMSGIQGAGATNIAVGGPLDEFYDWLLTNGIPGGETRIDELREGVDA